MANMRGRAELTEGMGDSGAWIAGEIADWPDMDRLVSVLREAGLHVLVGRHSIRVEDCSHFVFAEYGRAVSEPQIDADADSVEAMLQEGKLVSDALARAAVRHRFEIYDARGDLAGYLHHDWPLVAG